MMNRTVYWVLLTGLIGVVGGGLAYLAHLPAPALIGSSLAVSLAAWFGAPMKMTNGLRNMGFTIIGTSLGAGITTGFLADLAHWPLSLGFLAISILLTLAISAAILVFIFGHSRDTAILASTPGTLSYVLAIAADGRGDAMVVLVMQGLRLLLIAAALPILIMAIDSHEFAAVLTQKTPLGYDVVALVFCVSFALGWLGTKASMPAAYLLAGMLVSGVLHGAGIIDGAFPLWLMTSGFIITGAVIGARFAGINASTIRKLLVAALCTVTASSAIAAVIAIFVSKILDAPFGQVWVAFAPGGVEAMAAMALSLGYDPAYVATHHVFRILFLIIVLPVVLKLFGRPAKVKNAQ